MQSILTLDLSSEPARALVVGLDGRTIRVLERALFPRTTIFKREPSQAAEPAPVQESDSSQPRVESLPPAEATLSEVIAGLTHSWHSGVVILPSDDYLSLTMRLPLENLKQIDQILIGEVQDVVPFDTADFLVEHQVVDKIETGGHILHVGMLPRRVVSDVLAACRGARFEPIVMTTPTGVLGALPYLGPDYFAKDCAFVIAHEGRISIAVAAGGKVQIDRVLPAIVTQDVSAARRALSELRLTVASAERSLKIQLERVYLLGEAFSSSELQQAIGRPVERINTAELITDAEPVELAPLAAVFAKDHEAPPAFTNFRVGDFAYSLQLRELLAGLSSVGPWLIALLIVAVMTIGGIYALRERRNTALRAAMHAEIHRFLPDLDLSTGNEAVTLNGRLLLIEAQLKSLGSLSRLTPLDAFYEVASDIASMTGVSGVTKVNIKDNKVRIEGRLASFGARDNLERVFRRKRDVYCKVDVENAGTGSNITFTIIAFLCE